MKKYILIFLLFSSNYLYAQDNLKFYIEKALINNLKLNSERKNFESAKNKVKISQEVNFYQSITLSGDQTSTTSTNKTNQSGTGLADSKLKLLKVKKFQSNKKFSLGLKD